MKQFLGEFMKGMLNEDEELMKFLIPEFPVGCRRLVPSVGYMESLHKENVKVVTEGIERIIPEGLVLKSGETVPVDVIVCATGFNTSFCPKYSLVGRKDDLRDRWSKEVAQAYLSFAVPGMPNFWSEFARKYLCFTLVYRILQCS